MIDDIDDINTNPEALEDFCSGEEIHWEDLVGLGEHEKIQRDREGLSDCPTPNSQN